MSERIKDGGSAFPSEYFDRRLFAEARETEGVIAAKEAATVTAPGMTLRDYFAAKAMSQGVAILVAHNNNLNEHQLMHLAKVAYSTADAMLAAREVTKP